MRCRLVTGDRLLCALSYTMNGISHPWGWEGLWRGAYAHGDSLLGFARVRD